MNNRPIFKRQQGVSLLEVLISVVVLSIGLLGLAGLQATSLKNNTSAYQRSLATIMAYDVIDRVRADMPNKASYAVGMGAAGSGNVLDWKNGVQASLPGSDASVGIDLSDKIIVIIEWDDDRNGTPLQLTTETSL